MITSGAVFVGFYTITGVSPRDTPNNATLPGPWGQTGLLAIEATDLEADIERAFTRATKIEKKQLRADDEVLEAEIDEAAKT